MTQIFTVNNHVDGHCHVTLIIKNKHNTHAICGANNKVRNISDVLTSGQVAVSRGNTNTNSLHYKDGRLETRMSNSFGVSVINFEMTAENCETFNSIMSRLKHHDDTVLASVALVKSKIYVHGHLYDIKSFEQTKWGFKLSSDTTLLTYVNRIVVAHVQSYEGGLKGKIIKQILSDDDLVMISRIIELN